ncbi:hypothetical protein CR513_37228, partial [Mucuna pruriens]
LEVSDCSAAQVIFNINDNSVTQALGIRLKKLSLTRLRKLEHVWDKDPEGIISLQVLQDMCVESCHWLESLFPTSVAKDLTRLEVLSVKDCRGLVQIFSKDEKAGEGAKPEFVFGRLTSLRIESLPVLRYLYPGLHTLEWPVLEELHAFDCDLVILKCQEDHPVDQVLIQIEKVLLITLSARPFKSTLIYLYLHVASNQIDEPKLQITYLRYPNPQLEETVIRYWKRQGYMGSRFDTLKCFQELDSALLYRFLDMLLPRIEKLAFSRCLFKKMFSAERPNADYTRILLHLKGLELCNMFHLKSIGLEHPWLQPFPENLQTLQVKNCYSLRNLVPCTISISNLTYLEVSDCSNLKSLFSSSTVKGLARVERMKIKKCESLEEIVSREGGESQEYKQIIFEKLQFLYLKELDKLRCFYPGNFALSFPSLEQVFVIDCSLMKTFSPFNKIEHSTKWFYAKHETPQQESDLNSAAFRMFKKKFSKSARSVSDLDLEDSPLLQEIWRDSEAIPQSCFSNLASLTVDGCQFLSDVVLPFNLLPLFTKLVKLQVGNCDSVKTIFDVKGITQATEAALFPLSFRLKELILEELPNLENVWNEDPHGILCMQLLQQVSVHNCKCLTSVFPASVAKDIVQLEKLVVKHCEELIAIVAEDNAADRKGTNLEFMIPCVTSLTLWDLPKFKYNSIRWIHDATTTF